MENIKVNYVFDERIRLTELNWERVFLNLTVESDYDAKPEFGLAWLAFPSDNSEDDEVKLSGKKCTLYKEVPVEAKFTDGNTYRFSLNITSLQDRSFLDNGRWRLVAHFEGDETYHISTITAAAAHTLPDKDKIFTYGKGKYSYNVYFNTFADEEDRIVPIMNSRFMIENNDWKEKYLVKERKTAEGKKNCLKKKSKIQMLQATYDHYEKKSKKNGKNVLFMSETKPYIWGNLKYIDERMKERGLDKEFKISYSFRTAVGKSNDTESWFKTIRNLADQDYVFVDDYSPIFNFLELSERTKLIQVWHAGEGFKAVGYSRFGRRGSPHPTFSGYKKYDYVITGSQRLVEIYSEVFGLPNKDILPLGMARMDDFGDEAKAAADREELLAKHPECKGRKLILFAPTFRGSGQKSAHYDYSRINFADIYELCGKEYIWAFKMHPFIKQQPDIPEEYRDRIINLSDYKDINDLYPIADMLITDYSSAYYEYSFYEKPILFYTYDRDIYEIVRGVHKDIKETAPGKVCDSFDELITALKNKDYEIEKTLKFSRENFGDFDGKASDRIIDTILLNK